MDRTLMFNRLRVLAAAVSLSALVSLLLYRRAPQTPGPAGARLPPGAVPQPPSFSTCYTQHRLFPDTVRTRNRLWQVVQNPSNEDEEIAISGAYFDDRPNIGQAKIVRLFAVGSFSESTALYCQLWYPQQQLPRVVQAAVLKLGRGLVHDDIQYYEWLLSCALPENRTLPKNVSVAFGRCDVSTTLTRIVYAEREQTVEFGVCVAVSYGTVDPYQLIEWLELNRILGVEEFNIYDSRLNSAAINVLRYYASELGVVNLRLSSPPIEDWCLWCQKLAVISFLNDCLYLNMYRYKYTLVIDLDEFIMPHKYPSLHSMLNAYTRPGQTVPSLLFRNAYFFFDFLPDTTTAISGVAERLLTPRHVTRLPASKQGYSPKSLVDARRCIVMLNHYCTVRTPRQFRVETEDEDGEDEREWTLVVSPSEALLHHYKKCHFAANVCSDATQAGVYDATALRFKSQLVERVEARVENMRQHGSIIVEYGEP